MLVRSLHHPETLLGSPVLLPGGIVLPLAGRSPEGRLVHLILQYFLSTKVDQLHENH